MIATPDGNVYINPTGNPGMATGGSGDVLTGIIAGLVAQNISPKNASIAGAYIHGYSGDIFSENETNRLSLSALGVRMSRKVQDEGYQNSKEYFQSVHGSSMTISEALNSYFTNEEIRFTGIRQIRNGMGTMKYTHVELHRRD